MEEKKTNISTSYIKNTSSFIKSLGGAKGIYNYFLSKNVNINIDSIYKWKNNGIPHRYILYIKELADNKDITLPEDIFPNNITSMINKTEIISNSDNNKKGFPQKKSRIVLYLVLVTFIVLILQFLYYQNNSKILNQKIVKLENLISSISIKDYDSELYSLNNAIYEQKALLQKHSLEIKELNSTTTAKNNKIKNLEANILELTNNNYKTNASQQNNSAKILMHLMIIKDNIKFSSPNLNNIDLINNYFSKINTTKNINLSLRNINNLSKVNLKSHKEIGEKISSILININKNENYIPDNNTKINILKYLKKLIKIRKIDNSVFMDKNNIHTNIINNLAIYNYDYILNAFKSVNNNIELNHWLILRG
jgi:hypothetical protein